MSNNSNNLNQQPTFIEERLSFWQRFKFLSPKKKIFWLSFFAITLLVFLGIFVFIFEARAQEKLLGLLAMPLTLLVSWLLYIPIYVFGKLISILIIPLLVSIASYNNFISQEGVALGWSIIRDLANMFFVIILLIIAFATILKVEAYHYKRLLPKLVIAAILVNFSKTIVGLLIDFGQVIMLTFVHAFEGAAAGNLIYGLQIDKILAITAAPMDVYKAWSSNQLLELIGSFGLGLIALVVVFAVLLVIIAVLMGRIVMLWIAIILSPLIFVLPLIPVGKKFSAQIWGLLTKYIMVGPVLAFFLWLTFTIIQGTTNIAGQYFPVHFFQGKTAPFQAFMSEFGQPETLLNYIIVIGLLMGALIITQQFGVIGSQFAGQVAGRLQAAGMRGILAPLALAGKGAKELGKYAGREVGVRLGIQPTWEKWKAGWQEGAKERTIGRERRLHEKYEELREKGKVRQFLASPAHFFENYWNWGTLGKALTGRLGEITGKELGKAKEERDKTEEAMKEAKAKTTLENPAEFAKEFLINRRASELFGDLEKEKSEEKRKAREAGVPLEPGLKKILKEAEVAPESDEGKEIIEKWDARRVREEAQQEARRRAEEWGGREFTYEKLDKLGREQLEKEADKTKAEWQTLKTGGLSAEQREVRDEELEKITRQIKSLLEDIKRKKALGKDATEEKKLYNESIAHENELRRYEATPEEMEANKTLIEELQVKEKKLQENSVQPYISEADRKRFEAEYEEKKKAYEKAEKRVEAVRPAVDYAIRREQLLAISEEMRDMVTDSWEELVTIAEDAIKRGNPIRAAGAYLKATAYGNENEFQNWFNKYSNAQGLRGIIEDIFIKEMKMSREQAMSIANQVSYTGEKFGHWGVGRAVVIKDGRQVWQDESKRQKEILAEIEKVDIERTMRDRNRLFMFNEIVKSAEDFRATGEREAFIEPYGLAYLVRNWEKLHSLIIRGRVQPNLAKFLATPHTIRSLQALVDKIPAAKQKDYLTSIKELEEYGKSALPEEGAFADLEQIIEKRRRGMV